MAKTVSNCLDIMRRALGRRNELDDDSNDNTLMAYLNDFVNLSMSSDVKLFEQFGTLHFTISAANVTGVYPFTMVGLSTTTDFINLSTEAFISLTTPPAASISWNRLMIYQDPGDFFDRWGVNNELVLIPGYPTEMLFYGNELTFRTIPDTDYDVFIYGYKVNPAFATDIANDLPYDYWLRYISYGAAMNYARDYRFDQEAKTMLANDFAHERKLMLTRTHNQIKVQRAYPKF
jgi:hypothetical protein